MVRLRNIRIENGIAEADYYPEDSEKGGHIVVDLVTQEYIHREEVDDFGGSYPAHAKYCLIKMAETGDKAERRTVMWY